MPFHYTGSALMREQPLPGLPDAGFCARFLASLPPDLASSFDRRQLFAIQQAFGPWNGVERRRGFHAVLALPWGRYLVGVSRIDARDRRAEALRGAALRGAIAGVAALALILGGAWLLLA